MTLHYGKTVQRDTDVPDLGAHFDPIDYLGSGLVINNATVTVGPAEVDVFRTSWRWGVKDSTDEMTVRRGRREQAAFTARMLEQAGSIAARQRADNEIRNSRLVAESDLALNGHIFPDNQSFSMNVPLGRCSGGKDPGALVVRENSPSSLLSTPASLKFLSFTNLECTVIESGGSIRQVKVPEGLIDVVTVNALKYQLKFYRSNQVGSFVSGLFQLTGTPYATNTIENPDTTGNSTNRMRVTNKEGNTFDYTHSGSGWSLVYGGGAASIDRGESWSNGVRTAVRELKKGTNTLVACIIQKHITNAFGTHLIEDVFGDSSLALTNSYSYSQTTNGRTVLHQSSEGPWSFSEDAPGRTPTNLFHGFLNQAPTNNPALTRVEIFDSSTNVVSGSGDLALTSPSAYRCRIVKLLGHEISREYWAFPSTRTNLYIRCTYPHSTWNDPANMVTTTSYTTEGLSKRAAEQSIEYPDGTMKIFEYSANHSSGYSTNSVCSRAPNASKTAIVDGIKQITVTDPMGVPAPHQSTFCRFFQQVDGRKVDEVILRIQEQIRGKPPKEDLVVLDGKEPKHGGGQAILSAVTVPSQFYLGSAIVEKDKTNEIPVARELFKRLDLEDRFVSLDALHTQDETARAVVLEHGGDYLLTVKDNRLTVHQNIETLVAAPEAASPPSQAHADPSPHPGDQQGPS